MDLNIIKKSDLLVPTQTIKPPETPQSQFQDTLYRPGRVQIKDTFQIKEYVSDGATAGNYDHFFTAQFPCEVIQAYEVHRVLGTNAGAVTLDIEKLTSGQALDAGVSVLSTTFNLKSTVNTPVRVKATTTEANRVLNPGDRLALKDSGTLTAVAGVLVVVLLKARSLSIDPTA